MIYCHHLRVLVPGIVIIEMIQLGVITISVTPNIFIIACECLSRTYSIHTELHFYPYKK